jgi:NAD(P)-dependent dehydrogenase (short-subunit alcohol dehydrogenase family)
MRYEELLGYKNKRVLVTGAASGIGDATARLLVELGAEVIALDKNPVRASVAQAMSTDLGDRAAIDAAVAKLGGPVRAVFCCAGLPGPPFSNLDVMLVNFVGLRHLVESLLPSMPTGSAIVSVSSVAGAGALRNLENVMKLLSTPSFEAARAFCVENPTVANGYRFAKECIVGYTMMRAKELASRGVRINCTSPGVTETGMLPQFHALVTKEWMEEHQRGFLGRYSKPEEQAWPLIFLNSDLASFMSGANVMVDAGLTGALATGQKAPPPPPPTVEKR